MCMLKGRLCGDVHGTDNQLGQGERSLDGPIFPTSRAILARVTPPTAYYHLSAGSAANFALSTKGLPKGHRYQSGIPRPGSPFMSFSLFPSKGSFSFFISQPPLYIIRRRGVSQTRMVLSEPSALLVLVRGLSCRFCYLH